MTRVTGRLVSAPRVMGRCGFASLFTSNEHQEARNQQIYVDNSNEAWEMFKTLRLGDIIEVGGEMFVTKTGEPTIRTTELAILQDCKVGARSFEKPDRNIQRQRNKISNILSLVCCGT